MKIVFHTAILPQLRAEWGSLQPLGFGYLSAYLKRARPDVETRLAHSEEELLAERAGVVALSAVTYNYGEARRAAAKVKEAFGATVVLGGPHVTALPERMDREFDYGVVGEGEETFKELIEHLISGKPLDGLQEIMGLVFWSGDERVVTPPRPLIDPLDSLPFPDRALFSREAPLTGGAVAPEGGAVALTGGAVSLITSRGCPFDCPFCASTSHWRRLRVHSAEYVIREIAEVAERYKPGLIQFEDDLFVADRKRLAAIAEEITRRGYHQRMKFHVSARSNLLTEEVCAILKTINTSTVFVGFESNCAATLQALGKRGATPETNQRAVDNVSRAGMKLIGSFIIGAPGETRDNAYETYQFIHRNLDAFASATTGVLRLLPGTEFWRRGMERGIIDENLTGIVFDSRDFDGWFSLSQRYPMLCETMTRGELMALLLAFNELGAVVAERARVRELEREAAALRARDINALGLKSTARALARKMISRIFK